MTFHFHISGRVQGVGFRPHVHQCAGEWQVTGQVSNEPDGVHILFNATSLEKAHAFADQILKRAPALAIIRKTSLIVVDDRIFSDFSIVTKQSDSIPDLLITPDFAMCPDCRQEFHDPGNRRYQYPFITCTVCGPRYSILRDLPYERNLTAMSHYVPCKDCDLEYSDVSNRRYFSQTNSCHQCGVRLSWHGGQTDEVLHEQHAILPELLKALQDGKTIAVKGIGGFLLLCDAENKEAIQTLRLRKKRVARPFAVLFPGIDLIREYTRARLEDLTMLQRETSPIVLLPYSPQGARHLDMNGIAPGLSSIGVMLPHAPLLEWIMSNWQRPVIATSGNLSGSCIVFQSGQKKVLSRFADCILDHDRDILIPQDDSVIRISQMCRKPIMLRRSRGYAPAILTDTIHDNPATLYAAGASIKSAFAIRHNKQVYVSQFLGNLESYDAQLNYQHTFKHLCNLLKAAPQVVLSDIHPDYPSTQWAMQLSQTRNIPIHKIQHHEAHFAAILGEHDLFDSKEKVLGVIWDGTGYGHDGSTWGGEFFIFESGVIRRVNHLQPFVNMSGDKMAREPRLSALSLAHDIPGAAAMLQSKFSGKEWDYYLKVIRQKPAHTTSAGRYFDAIASLLNLSDFNTYEGQAGLLLEEKALEYFNETGYDIRESYYHPDENASAIDMKGVITRIVEDAISGRPATEIAAVFHKTLADIISHMARLEKADRIACSGGVFQNSVLVDLIALQLGKSMQVYFHDQLPPNDECVAFGQLMHYLQIKKA